MNLPHTSWVTETPDNQEHGNGAVSGSCLGLCQSFGEDLKEVGVHVTTYPRTGSMKVIQTLATESGPGLPGRSCGTGQLRME